MDYGGKDQTVDQGCVWLFACRSKSVGAGLDRGLCCTPTQSVTQNPQQLVALYKCYMLFPLPLPSLPGPYSRIKGEVERKMGSKETKKVPRATRLSCRCIISMYTLICCYQSILLCHFRTVNYRQQSCSSCRR